MNANIIELLEKYELKPTPMRMLVLEQLLIQRENLSVSDIENALYPADRVTIYRTLQTFAKNGLVHVTELVNVGSVYAFCGDLCEKNKHSHEHPHFYCECCKKTSCTKDFVFRLHTAPLAAQYRLDKVEVLLKGLCPECAARSSLHTDCI
jgi:Fur family ferric uptake transcriptional regulator